MHPAARFMPFFLSTSAARLMPFSRRARRPGGASRAVQAAPAAAYPMDTTR